MNNEPKNELEIIAEVSTKKMFLLLLKAQEMTLENNRDKREILQLLSSVEHDVLLINDANNSIDRDLFR